MLLRKSQDQYNIIPDCLYWSSPSVDRTKTTPRFPPDHFRLQTASETLLYLILFGLLLYASRGRNLVQADKLLIRITFRHYQPDEVLK